MAEEAMSEGSRAREAIDEVLGWRVPAWTLVVVLLVGGAFVLGLSTNADAGDGGGTGVQVLDGEVAATSCTDVLAAAHDFITAGETNSEIYVAVDPETGDWAVELTADEERCGLRYREVLDRLSSSATAEPAAPAPPDEPGF